MQEKYRSMEKLCMDIEERYEREILSSSTRGLEVQALSTIKNKYTVKLSNLKQSLTSIGNSR